MGRSSNQGGSFLVSSLACWHSKELAELGSQDQAHRTITLPVSWGIGTLAVAVALVSKVQECADLMWNWDLGLWSDSGVMEAQQ